MPDDVQRFTCRGCGKTWSSQVIAEDCAEQDEIEQADLTNTLRIHRSTN